MSKWIRLGTLPALCLLGVTVSGCGDFVRQGSGSSAAFVATLEAASGADPAKFSNTLSSDVITLVKKTIGGAEVLVPTIFGDAGRVTVSAEPKDPATSPTSVNSITFTRYRVTYVRTDGRNVPGVDVPYPFDSGVTFTVTAGGTAQAVFDLVRNSAKTEAPLVALASNLQLITVIANVTFYGKDHAGNDVSAEGQIGITFGNFGDPD